MNSAQLWQTFLKTGSPEDYVLFCKARKQEAAHAFDHQSFGSEGNTLR